MNVQMNNIRKDFPLLSSRDTIYLDNAATNVSLKRKTNFMRNTMPIRSGDFIP